MARTAKIEKEKQRHKSVVRHSKKRSLSRDSVRAAGLSGDIDKLIGAVSKLALMPRDSSATRGVRRCVQCGRPKGVYRKFQLCRICLRNQLMEGNVPGGRKSSW